MTARWAQGTFSLSAGHCSAANRPRSCSMAGAQPNVAWYLATSSPETTRRYAVLVEPGPLVDTVRCQHCTLQHHCVSGLRGQSHYWLLKACPGGRGSRSAYVRKNGTCARLMLLSAGTSPGLCPRPSPAACECSPICLLAAGERPGLGPRRCSAGLLQHRQLHHHLGPCQRAARAHSAGGLLRSASSLARPFWSGVLL